MTQQQQNIVLQGGLDIVTPANQVPPGFAIAAQNYESEARGYRRADGYERLDGQPKPSEASYWLLAFDQGSTAISEGDTLTGATSGATGVVLEDPTVSSGSWAGSDAAGEVILYNVSGTFQDNEAVQVSASTVAYADGTAVENGASDDANDDAYLQSAIEKRRALIAAVPGSGGVLGICTYKGDIYAWRNNAGGTEAVMHKAIASGWAAQSLGHMIDFTAGNNAAMVEGETVTGGTSGATATVERVGMLAGAWGGSGAGYLVLSGISGTFQAAETLTGGTSGGTATASGAQAAITLPAGGKYRAVNHNFFGTSNLERVYGVNGEGPAFEWDGTVFAPIRKNISASLDKPQFVAVHSNHLLTGYAGGSILYAGTGEPLDSRAVAGAGEIGFGQDLTGLKSSTRTATIITGRTRIGYLQGNDTSDFVLSFLSEDSGAVADTLEVVGQPYFLDDQGVRSMSAAQTFGNWKVGTVTQLIEPMIRAKRENGIIPVGALRVRGKDQYRLYFTDATCISLYFGRKNPEAMPLLIGFTPTVVVSGEDGSGNEILLAGADDGMVYQLDKGTSADGVAVDAYLRLSFLHQNAPTTMKRYHRGVLQVSDGGSDISLTYASDFDFGNPDIPSGSEAGLSFKGGGGFWDTAFWDNFYWDSAVQGQAEMELNGIGQNVSIALASEAIYEKPHVLSSLTINYTPRRSIR
ncbi:hypothetical protein [Leisingera sp. M523]|uniref:hypothetical protein n=1 Tax=Leisingera sp. M523 TaxID=2867013 RepID=UPI0021A2F7FF|nr:hypothetical protein [Leisingera sp. M523]UWQ30260.1 hypothetical protein K3557_06905 [Leisingera sp. M523]